MRAKVQGVDVVSDAMVEYTDELACIRAIAIISPPGTASSNAGLTARSGRGGAIPLAVEARTTSPTAAQPIATSI